PVSAPAPVAPDSPVSTPVPPAAPVSAPAPVAPDSPVSTPVAPAPVSAPAPVAPDSPVSTPVPPAAPVSWPAAVAPDSPVSVPVPWGVCPVSVPGPFAESAAAGLLVVCGGGVPLPLPDEAAPGVLPESCPSPSSSEGPAFFPGENWTTSLAALFLLRAAGSAGDVFGIDGAGMGF